MKHVIEAISRHKVIVIMRKLPDDKIIPVTQALYDGGIRLIEVTFDQSDPNCLARTGGAIHAIADAFEGRMYVGAGTVLTKQQVDAAHASGAQFIISPNTDPEIIRHTVDLGMISIPGALTPSEIVLAHNCGAKFVKVFPGGDFGPGYIKAVCAPINHIPLLVVGGVNADNMQAFMDAGAVGIGVGSNIVDKKLIDSGDYAKLTELAKTYTSQIDAG